MDMNKNVSGFFITVNFKTKQYEVKLQPSSTCNDLYLAVSQKIRKSIDRITLQTIESSTQKYCNIPQNSEKIEKFKIHSKTQLQLIDKGAQINYRFSFILEYIGPIIVWSLLIAFRNTIYTNILKHPSCPSLSSFQKMVAAFWIFNFLKRVYESIFVHKFSRKTKQLSEIFLSVPYYYGYALLVGLSILSPKYKQPSNIFIVVGFAIFFFGMMMNGYCHMYLSNLRKDPSSKQAHPIPSSWPFRLVVCPNYMFEILTWIGFNIATQTLAGLAFNITGMIPMYMWAVEKRARYVSEHPDYPKNKSLIIPFIG